MMIPPAKAYSNPFVFDMDWTKPWKKHFSAESVFGFTSCRQALFELLMELKKNSDKKQVLVAAFTCPSVIETIKLVGLEVAFCDLNEKFEISRESLVKGINDQTLAVIFTYLYGAKDPILETYQLFREKNIFIIEDVSLALGLEMQNLNYGSIGDATICSLGFGKIISTGGGGILALRSNKINKKFNQSFDLLPPIKVLLQFIVYNILLNTNVFGILYWLGFRLNEDVHGTESKTTKWSYFQAWNSAAMISKLPHLIKNDLRKTDNIAKIEKSLNKDNSIFYSRYPFVIGKGFERKKVMEELRNHQIYASYSFYEIEKHIPHEMSVASEFTKRLIAIPIHSGLSVSRVQILIKLLEKYK